MSNSFELLHERMYQRYPNNILHFNQEIDNGIIGPCHFFNCGAVPCYLSKYYYFFSRLFFRSSEIDPQQCTYRINFHNYNKFVVSAMVDDLVYAECFPFFPDSTTSRIAMFDYFDQPCAVDLSNIMASAFLENLRRLETMHRVDNMEKHSIYFNRL